MSCLRRASSAPSVPLEVPSDLPLLSEQAPPVHVIPLSVMLAEVADLTRLSYLCQGFYEFFHPPTGFMA